MRIHLVGALLGITGIVGILLAVAGWTVPGLVLVVWLLALPFYAIWAAVPVADRRAMSAILAAALTVRLVLCAVILGFLQRAVFTVFDDSQRYEEIGTAVASAWHAGANLDLLVSYQLSVAGFYYVVGALAFVSGGSPFVIGAFNASIAAITGVVLYRLGLELRAARRERLLGVCIGTFMPSVVFWSVLPLKDTLVSSILLLGVVVAFGLVRRPGPIMLAALCASMLVLSSLRLYGTLFLALTAVVALVGSGLIRRRLVWAVVIFVAIGLTQAFVLAGPAGSLVRLAATDITELERQQTNFEGGGSSVRATNMPTEPAAVSNPSAREAPGVASAPSGGPTPSTAPAPTTPTDRLDRYFALIARTPTYFAQFLLLPVPLVTPGQLVNIALPEMLVWYALLPAAVFGMAILWRRERFPVLLVTVLFLSIGVVYGTIVGNSGSLMRYRAQAILLLAVPMAAGAAWIWAHWRRPRSVDTDP